MFDDYTYRARQVIFIARLKAGNAGAKTIKVDHLVAALVIEDGGPEGMATLLNVDPNLVGRVKVHGVELHPGPFFSPEMASLLLTKIEELFPPSPPVPKSQEMPISSELNHLFGVAQDIKREFQSGSIEPLHLLAAALREPSSGASQVLFDAGITQEKVSGALGKNN